MVYSVYGQVKEDKAEDPESQWETISTVSLIDRKRRRERCSSVCVVFPWILLLLCLAMLGCVSAWGWREHFKVQELEAMLGPIDKVLTPPQSEVESPQPEYLIPYGDDGLEAEEPYEEGEIGEKEEHQDEENPQSTSEEDKAKDDPKVDKPPELHADKAEDTSAGDAGPGELTSDPNVFHIRIPFQVPLRGFPSTIQFGRIRVIFGPIKKPENKEPIITSRKEEPANDVGPLSVTEMYKKEVQTMQE